MDKQASSRTLDEAREKIAKWLFRETLHPTGKIEWEHKWTKLSLGDKGFYLQGAREILNLSGTTDIMCDECDGGWHEFIKPCPKCQGEKSIKHKWKIAVVLENGELPEMDKVYADKYKGYYGMGLDNMRNAGYRQVVE